MTRACALGARMTCVARIVPTDSHVHNNVISEGNKERSTGASIPPFRPPVSLRWSRPARPSAPPFLWVGRTDEADTL